jgi:exosortase
MKAFALENDNQRSNQAALLLAGLCITAAATAWAYWPTLAALAAVWARDPQYSHGYLVPLFAAVLLWRRRARAAGLSLSPDAWGVAILLGSALLRLTAAYFYYPWLDMLSLLPCLAGLVVLCGGWPALRWAWPAVAFLLFMLPLPFRLGIVLAPTLQRLATVASTYTLQTLGFPAICEGNIIILGESRIGVVEACGGLSMLIVFFALSTAVAMLVRRDALEKGVIVASAIPIALIANVARITLTALLHNQLGGQAAELFHDLAGWFMMPLALGLLWVELKLLARLFPALAVYGVDSLDGDSDGNGCQQRPGR